MNNIYKCRSKVISTIVDQGTSSATTTTEVIAPSGTRACVRSFSGYSTTSRNQNASISADSVSTLVTVSFKKASGSTVFEFFLPVLPPSSTIEVGGNGGHGTEFHIPGPGLLFDEGLTVEMVVPSNPNTGLFNGGQTAGLLTLVYSL
jgi:hypothetical protein